MRRLKIFDTTLRDGAKSLGLNLNINEKMEISRQLVKLGADVIEAGYPACSAADLEAVRAIAREVKDVVICGFSGADEREIDCCAGALRGAAQPRIHTGLAVSPQYMKRKLRLTPEQVVEKAVFAVKRAKKYVSDVQFYTEDAFRSQPSFVAEIIEKVIEAGATVVNIPDTFGYATPWEYSELISYLMDNVRNIDRAEVSVHCHNDLGMATANSLAGIKAGASQVEGTINGIGERAGNTSLEEAIMAVYTRQAAYGVELAVKTTEIAPTCRLAARITGVPVPAHKAIVGANAFKGDGGIYADDISGEGSPYEVIRPDAVGVTAGDDQQLLAEEMEVSDSISVKNISITTTGVSRATATVTLDVEGDTITDAACGNGPVDAVFKAVERMVGEHVNLEDFSLKSVSRGSESLGDATVKVRCGDSGLVVGRGVSADIIEASARAYVNAIAKVKTLSIS
ncbi:2-isopropylmalate synthase [Pelotomaculum propionicicum]|uniref:2-isopropylmalate synthase n=1 Tax=Pelotomaculum propionicicum TaxID=258475 RepID=UPI003B7E0EF9